MLKIEEIRDTGEFMKLAEVWNNLLSKSEADTIFLTWEWVSNWWKVYGNNKDLFVLTLKDNDHSIVGIAPLYIRKSKVLIGFTVNEIRFLGTGEDVSPDYLDFIIEKERESDAIDAFIRYFASSNKWDVLNFTDMESTSCNLKYLTEAVNHGRFSIRQSECASCPYIALPSSWERYLSTLTANARYNVKRKMKNLERDFKTRYFLWEDVEGLDGAMDRLAYLHNKRWDERERSHSFSSNEYVSFHKAVAKDFARNGWLRLSCLELNGELAGMLYDYYYGGKILYYQAGFDPSFYKYSPGLVLRAYVIQKAIAEGVGKIDLLKGAYAHKYMWTPYERKTVYMVIGSDTAASKIFFLNAFQKPRIKAAIKKALPASVLELAKR